VAHNASGIWLSMVHVWPCLAGAPVTGGGHKQQQSRSATLQVGREWAHMHSTSHSAQHADLLCCWFCGDALSRLARINCMASSFTRMWCLFLQDTGKRRYFGSAAGSSAGEPYRLLLMFVLGLTACTALTTCMCGFRVCKQLLRVTCVFSRMTAASCMHGCLLI
jgi:hypothetical protein